jgi:hypothetical protein
LFLGYIHYFRALAIFFIVSGHSIDSFTWEGSENIEKTLRILFSNGSILFVFIAGYLFQHLSKKYEIIKYYKSKLNYVLLPYFLISIPAILVFTFILERETVWNGFYENPLWIQVTLFYVTGLHLNPLWFIPMITIFYFLAPWLIKEDKRKWIYFLLPLFIILSCYVGRGLPHRSFIHFFSVYLLGMWCSRYKDIINEKLRTQLVIFILFTLVITLSIIEFVYMQETMTFVNYLQKISMALLFIGILVRFNSKLNSKFISSIAETSFGIFFIHSYVLTAEKMGCEYFFGAKVAGDVLLWICLALVNLIICTYVIILIKKVLGRYSRYIVGS